MKPSLFLIRTISSGLEALWSKDKFTALPFLERTVRESPIFAQKMCLPTINANEAVLPHLWEIGRFWSKNSSSKFLKVFYNAKDIHALNPFLCMPKIPCSGSSKFFLSSFSKFYFIKCAHQSPPWPSKTPNIEIGNCGCKAKSWIITKESSILARLPGAAMIPVLNLSKIN